ncbi:MAG: glycosyltransferase family 39 protein [bacterium]|nr:glycosyltransferase family 39 protein [bacterium]
MRFFPHWSVLLLLLSILTLAVRLTNLMNVPIFTDEGGYLHSAVLIRQNFFENWDMPMREFFGPTGFLYMWIVSLLMRLIFDPLLAGRIVSVLAGLGTGLGVFFLGKRLFTPTVGLLAFLLVALSPIHVLSDRTAVMDSLLGTMFIWSLFFAAKLGLSPQWRWAVFSGVFLGLSVWAKPTGKLFFAVIPTILLLAKWTGWRMRNADNDARHPKWIAMLLAASLGIGYLFILFLKLSPSSNFADTRVREFVTSTQDLLTQPWVVLMPNLSDVFAIFWMYYDLPFFLILPAIVGLLCLKQQTRLRFLGAVFAVSIGLILLLAQTFGSKYVTFSTLPLLLMIAATIVYLPKMIWKKNALVSSAVTFILLILLALPMIRQNVIILFDPINDHYYYRDKTWATTGSGYGIDEVVKRIRTDASDNPTLVLAEGISGHLWQTLSVYLSDRPNIDVQRFERVLNMIPEGQEEERKRSYYPYILDQHKEKSLGKTVFLAEHNDLAMPLDDPRLTLLFEEKKPTTPQFNRGYWLRLYRVTSGFISVE